MASQDEPRVQDAAMSLCALGRSRDSSPDPPDDCAVQPRQQNPNAVFSSSDVAPVHIDGTADASSIRHTSMDIQLNNRLQIYDTTSPLPPPSASAPRPTKAKVAPKKARLAAAAKHNVKPRDPKRDTSVPFDEMKRLMRVYGSLKCLRNRTPVDSGRTAKIESVKRKFYRWFPDLDERFIRTPEGWYKPKGGHEEEMRYREAMRKEDQESLVKKRNTKRASTKLGGPQTAV
eukprot:CAMPEP_0172534852 /NCGR_PEP_ID=MMETSP1067-20121228/7079_1 /TAXON_ID=265564 ORGANISM="Thalassiosira punctigera, Strain Tpunct2005C2" /NCGR_SAMPLE_ID=MMETSP1067 /ASSEMBLY_ACC=CAM_ASM_000444 /LENGTH=230 /DNA_ID=CAMNT_0013319699 /DNA_START=161 /DNA_END=853 /DNA_ORIENTATION=+